MEGAAKTPFLQYMHEQVFIPLKMSSTGPELRNMPSRRASLYAVVDGVRQKVTDPEDTTYKWAGGGMITTPTDLVRMGHAYFDGFLQPKIVSEVFATQHLRDGTETNIGLGWRRSFDMERRPVMEHAGGMQGARSVLVLFPQQRLAIAVMTNVGWTSSIEETAHVLALPFLSSEHATPLIQGTYDVKIKMSADPQRVEQADGKLKLTGSRGELVSVIDGTQQQFPIVYLHRNAYALIRPDGAFYLSIEKRVHDVRGKAVLYWSALAKPPTDAAPCNSFE
jgi:CubicO group peptidase (beta-lactamase class C family)